MALKTLGDFLVTKHSAIAKVVLPCSVAFGFAYTMNRGTNPLSDLKQSVTGAEQQQPMTYKLSYNRGT
jgi:hypothetical protein